MSNPNDPPPPPYAMISYGNQREFIVGARLGDPRVAERLDQLAMEATQCPAVEFVEDFL